MLNTKSKEFYIKLPVDIAISVSENEIINMLLFKSLNRTEYFNSKCRIFQEKYNLDFETFKKRVEESNQEVFYEWDDLILWEGYKMAFDEWNKKYKELSTWKV